MDEARYPLNIALRHGRVIAAARRLVAEARILVEPVDNDGEPVVVVDVNLVKELKLAIDALA